MRANTRIVDHVLPVALAAMVGLVAIAPMPAWQWPVPEPVVSRTFGQDAGGYLMRGIELSADVQPVYPIDRGVVVAVRSDTAYEDGGRAPSGLGSYVVIEHAQGFRSVYAHMEADVLPEVGQSVGPETQIGVIGESGLVPGRALRLYVVDLESGDFVNPILLLPDLADARAPSIAAVYARAAGALFDLDRTRELPVGQYEITARVEDSFARARTAPIVSPYSVRMFVAGQESFRLVMDRITTEEGESRIEPGGGSAPVLYGVQGLLRLGTVTVRPGQTELEIVSSDFAGNQSSWRVDLTGVAPSAEATEQEGASE